jgi:hypothetical protein
VGLWTLSIVWNSKQPGNTTFRKMNLFLSSSEWRETHNLLSPLERTNVITWQPMSYKISYINTGRQVKWKGVTGKQAVKNCGETCTDMDLWFRFYLYWVPFLKTRIVRSLKRHVFYWLLSVTRSHVQSAGNHYYIEVCIWRTYLNLRAVRGMLLQKSLNIIQTCI